MKNMKPTATRPWQEFFQSHQSFKQITALLNRL
jgi:hypothetical protein